MIVREAVVMAAYLLGLGEQIEEHFSAFSEEGEKNLNLLLDGYNVVENELATDGLPVTFEDTIDVQTGKVYFDNFSKEVLTILRVRGENGEKVPFETYPSFLSTNYVGRLSITYAYVPYKKTISGTAEVNRLVSKRLVAYGICKNFCLAKGLYDESLVWDKEYKKALTKAYRSKPAVVVRSRRWA